MLEVELLKLCHPEMDDSAEGLRHRIAHLEEEVQNGVVVVQGSNDGGKPEGQGQISIASNKKFEKKVINVDAVPEDIKQVIHNWGGVVERMEAMTKAFLKGAFPINLEDEIIYIVCENDIAKNHLSQEEIMGTIDDVLSDMFEKKFKIKIIGQEEYNQLTNKSLDKEETMEDAKNIYEQIKSKINFDIEIR